MRHIPSETVAPGDPPGCWYDMHALREPEGNWAYEIDDHSVSYGAGNWPYHWDRRPCGVFLTPDIRYYAWRNHIVLAAPGRRRGVVIGAGTLLADASAAAWMWEATPGQQTLTACAHAHGFTDAELNETVQLLRLASLTPHASTTG